MALALDTTSSNAVTDNTSNTHAHTCTGSDLILIALIGTWDVDGQTDGVVTSATYAGSAMTKIDALSIGTNERSEIWYIVNPSTGSNNVVVTVAGHTNVIDVHCISLTGAAQSGQPDNSNTNTNSGVDPQTASVTTSDDNCWVVSICNTNVNGGLTPAGGQTQIASTSSGYVVSSYNGPKTPAGSVTHTYSNGGNDSSPMVIASISPAVAATRRIFSIA